MLVILWSFLHEHFTLHSLLRLFQYLSFRSMGAALTATAFSFLLSRWLIRYLHSRAFIDQARDTGIPSASDKAGTPAMGGLALVGAVMASSLLWCDLRSLYVAPVLLGLAWFGLIGFQDDLSKFRGGSGERGMGEGEKLFLQGAFALAFALYACGPFTPLPAQEATALYVPFIKFPLFHAGWLYVPFAVLFVILVGNSANLADGLDGLAIMPSIFVFSVLGVFSYISSNAIWSSYLQYPFLRGSGELGVFCSAFIGAGVGFLWYNAYPAELFMGDTGSLAIGGSMATVCVLLKQEFLFPLLGGLFVAEAFTSQVQDKIGVKWLGRRIFPRAPLHHALQYRGLAETKVVIRLWIVSGILALLALATIKIR